MSEKNNSGLSFRDIVFLRLQMFTDWLLFPVLGNSVIFFIRFIKRNRISNLKEIRRQYRRAVARGIPTVICSNHLTMWDSFYIHFALGDFWSYFLSFRTFSWNIPAVESFKNSNLTSLITYLGKSIPIDRQGSAEHHELVLNKLKYLLNEGETVTIFPEGGRSRTGRVEPENVTYGVGNILKELEDYQVLVVYMRALSQSTHSVMPPTGDPFYFRMEVMKPVTSSTGMRASRDLSVQIINRIKEMEDDYFALHSEKNAVQSPVTADAR